MGAVGDCARSVGRRVGLVGARAVAIGAPMPVVGAGRKGAERIRRALPDVMISDPKYLAHDPWDLWVSRPDALRALVR